MRKLVIGVAVVAICSILITAGMHYFENDALQGQNGVQEHYVKLANGSNLN